GHRDGWPGWRPRGDRHDRRPAGRLDYPGGQDATRPLRDAGRRSGRRADDGADRDGIGRRAMSTRGTERLIAMLGRRAASTTRHGPPDSYEETTRRMVERVEEDV